MRRAIISVTITGLLLFSQNITADVIPSAQAGRQTPLVKMIQQVRPAVVSILVRGERGYGSGSGTIIHPHGFVLTNHHVIQNRSGFVLVEGRRVRRYRPVSSIPEMDLAIIRIEEDPGKPFAVMPLGRSSDLLMGEDIINLGNPGGRGVVATRGIISSPSIRIGAMAIAMANNTLDELDRFIQFDATSNPGNSGGAIVTADGLQVGVTSGYLSKENNVNLAIPIDRFHQNLESLLSSEVLKQFRTGLRVKAAGTDIVVAKLEPDSPAEKSGLTEGDVLRTWQGAPLTTMVDFQFARAEAAAGREISLTVASTEGEVRDLVMTPTVRGATAAIDEATAKDLKPGLVCVADHFKKDIDYPFRQKLEVDQTLTAKKPTAAPAGLEVKDLYRLRFTGMIRIDRNGAHRFSIGADDGCRLSVDGTLLINNDGHHPMRYRGGWANLKAGWHPIVIDYFEISGKEELILKLFDENGKPLPLTNDHYAHSDSDQDTDQ